MDPSEEIKRLYFQATPKTIDRDLARAIDLLRAMPDEEARERLAVYMDGLSQMRNEARAGGGGGSAKPGSAKARSAGGGPARGGPPASSPKAGLAKTVQPKAGLAKTGPPKAGMPDSGVSKGGTPPKAGSGAPRKKGPRA